jgi:hypothetical protein
MANPFPGMDPYLEGDLWTSVQFSLVAAIARDLAPRVRPKYIALSNCREVVAPPDETEWPAGGGWPDYIVKPGRVVDFRAALTGPIPQAYLEIVAVPERRPVTVIEVLSPTNKRGVARPQYEKVRTRRLASPVHLLDIDLIRVGERFWPLPLHQPSPYSVALRRAGQGSMVDVWPVEIEQPLPVVPVPLLPGDADMALDLNPLLRSIHELFRYDEQVDYSQPPPGPLTPEQAAWIDRRLREAGRRP